MVQYTLSVALNECNALNVPHSVTVAVAANQDHIEMVTSSITGGREWPLASSESVDAFWREFQSPTRYGQEIWRRRSR